jgi:hypothetical protein
MAPVWYLVFFSVTTYLGPMSHEDCLRAQMVFQSATCREVKIYTTCPIAGHPEASRICPDFYATEVK